MAGSPAVLTDCALIPDTGAAGSAELNTLTRTVLETKNTTGSLNHPHSKTNKISSYPWHTEIQPLVY